MAEQSRPTIVALSSLVPHRPRRIVLLVDAKNEDPTPSAPPCELPGISSLRHARNKPLPGGSFMTFLLENSSSNPKAKPMKFEGHGPYFRLPLENYGMRPRNSRHAQPNPMLNLRSKQH